MFLILNQLGICCVYVVFVASNFKLVIDESLPKPWAVEMYILMIMLPFVLMLSVKNLKMLAPFSLAANIVALVTFGVVGYYFFTNLPHIKHAAYFASPLKYPLYFGTTLFAILAIGVVRIQNILLNKIREEKIFPVIPNSGFTCSALSSSSGVSAGGLVPMPKFKTSD